jgi:cysteinyl-tRNA synthetase
MPVFVYNSLSRKKEEFVPVAPPKVKFYNCGPTVYGEFHIGNARNFVVFDMIRRWLMERGYDVHYAQNITDVDDKIIDRANQEGTTTEAITTKFTEYFFDKLKALGNLPADDHPRATKHIGPIIAMIKKLVDRGHAYASKDGSVWYEVASFPSYGKLSRMLLDQMRQGERVNQDQQALKRSPIDFCLWKGAKPGEPSWKSPWGEGRPGWHIECSCMSMSTLKTETIDIHGGGVDLRFPHHENEIAQSEGATGRPYVNYWLHNGMLDIDGEKMSKSIGNIKSIDDVLHIIDGLTLRYFLLSARYRDKLDFTPDALHKCLKGVERLVLANKEAKRVLGDEKIDSNWSQDPALQALWDEFSNGMDDDFNTPKAFASIFNVVTEVNTARTAAETGGDKVKLARAAALLLKFRNCIGLGIDMEPEDTSLDESTIAAITTLWTECGGEGQTPPEDPATMIEQLIEWRTKARKEKDFALSDRIRNDLTKAQILLEDKPGTTLWRKK